MSKCKVCGEEIGTNQICPICGTKQIIKKVVEQKEEPKIEINKPELSIFQQIEKEKVELVQKCVLSVVRVIKRNKTYNSVGSGWITRNNLVVTNAHVLLDQNGQYDPNDTITIELNENVNTLNKTLLFKIEDISLEEDVAILSPKESKIPSCVPALEIADRETKQGEYVFTIGNPLHYKFTYTEGVVANPHYHRDGGHFHEEILQTTLTLNNGNSGGPVFDAYGKVVGMTTFCELDSNEHEIKGYGFCVKNFTILKMIKNKD